MLTTLRRHAENCRTVGRLLGRTRGHLAELYWYDLRLADAVGPGGLLKVATWNLFRRRADEIAGNYGLTNLYFAAPSGDGRHRSAPTVWHCRSLDSRPWWGEGDDPVRAALEANAQVIAAEYREVADRLLTHPDNTSLADRGRWTGLFFSGAKGVRNDALCALCPETTGVVESLPVCRNFGFVAFSGMDPHTHVAPHCGSSNLRLRYHLGVDVAEPGKSWIRVGETRRCWQQGRVLAFDDSFEHEVEHEGDRRRVVLIVDVWHPSLSPAEIAVLSDPVFQRFGKA